MAKATHVRNTYCNGGEYTACGKIVVHPVTGRTLDIATDDAPTCKKCAKSRFNPGR